jgi:hypothetical protein
MTVAYTEANDTAQAWLAANGNPTTVTFDISAATIKCETGSSSPAVNDCVHVSANTPASGLVLPAVRVSIHHCDGEDSGLQGYRGQVTGVSGSQITLTYTDANDAAQAWLNANGNPVSVTFDISSATIESSTGSQTPAQGDCAEVSATTPASGLILPAVTVELHVCGHGGDGEGDGDGGGDHASLQRYRGTVTGVSGSQVTVTYSDANDTAQTWLDANGDPTTVTFDISAATVESTTGSTTPAVNDCIGVSATTPASGLILPAVSVVLHTCETQDGSYQIYGGTVTNVTGSQMTVTYSFTNDNANTWLAANGNPTSVTFDLTGATIDSHTGSPTPNVNDCAGVAATTPASGLVLPAVFVELFTCGSGPGGGE